MLYYVIEALAYLGGQGTLTEIYDIVTEQISNTKYAIYRDKNSFHGTVRKVLENYAKKTANFNGTNVFERVDRGVWKLQEPYYSHIRKIKKLIKTDTEIVAWWYCGNYEFCAFTDNKVYFLSDDGLEEIFCGSLSAANLELDNDEMILRFEVSEEDKKSSKKGKFIKNLFGWEIRFDYDEKLFHTIDDLIKLTKNKENILNISFSYYDKYEIVLGESKEQGTKTESIISNIISNLSHWPKPSKFIYVCTFVQDVLIFNNIVDNIVLIGKNEINSDVSNTKLEFIFKNHTINHILKSNIPLKLTFYRVNNNETICEDLICAHYTVYGFKPIGNI